MTMPTLIYIDEEPRARALLGRRLKKCVGDGINIVTIEPEKTVDEMILKIEEYEDLVSIVIDQKLTAAGTADYVGTELVTRFRLIDHVMPIYILTNYTHDVASDLATIEYVLNKDDLQDTEKLTSIGIRIRRHIDIFQSFQTKKEQRFEELLRKKFDEDLTVEEAKEFSDIKFQRERKIIASKLLENEEFLAKIAAAEKKLEEIEGRLK